MEIEERELRFARDAPLLGWRLFRIRRDGAGLLLSSPMYHDPDPPPWPHATGTAACAEGHRAPAPGCRCGIYAAVPGTLDSLPGYLRDTAYDGDPWAYAEVACSGRVFLDARGVRAERAEVVRIALAEHCWPDGDALSEARRALGARYGVPVAGLAAVPGWVTDNLRDQGPPPDDVKLDHVVWLGGGTGGGKTTVARLLAARHGLRLFQVDSFWYDHDARLGEPVRRPEEQWLAPPVEQAREFEASSRRRLRLVLEDLERLPREPAVLVEGPQVLPDLLPDGAAAAFLVPTRRFQEAILARRSMPETSDGRRALANRIEKDRRYGERVAALAAAHGFPVVRVDGSRPPADVAAEVERALAPALPAPARVDLGPVRRWENEAFAANVRSWLASPDAPLGPPGPFSFACECGRPGCAARVELTIDAFEALPRVVAEHD